MYFRWLRLRFNMMPLISGVLEPMAECIPMGAYAAWCFYHFLGINPYIIFGCHVCSWLVSDFILLRMIQVNYFFLFDNNYCLNINLFYLLLVLQTLRRYFLFRIHQSQLLFFHHIFKILVFYSNDWIETLLCCLLYHQFFVCFI